MKAWWRDPRSARRTSRTRRGETDDVVVRGDSRRGQQFESVRAAEISSIAVPAASPSPRAPAPEGKDGGGLPAYAESVADVDRWVRVARRRTPEIGVKRVRALPDSAAEAKLSSGSTRGVCRRWHESQTENRTLGVGSRWVNRKHLVIARSRLSSMLIGRIFGDKMFFFPRTNTCHCFGVFT